MLAEERTCSLLQGTGQSNLFFIIILGLLLSPKCCRFFGNYYFIFVIHLKPELKLIWKDVWL
jgi:hypothetical protein